MTPAIFGGERFGMGHMPIATPTNPATGQPLSPYAPQTGGFGHPSNVPIAPAAPAPAGAVGGFGHPAAPLTPAAYAGTDPVGAARNAAFNAGVAGTTPGVTTQPGATTAPAGGQTFRNQFGTYTVPAGDPYYAQGTQPSTNPATFTTNQYESGLNENWAAQMVNMYNAANPGQPPTTFNEADWNQYWNSLTKGGTGFNPSAQLPAGMFSGPGAQSLDYQMGGGGPAPAYGLAPNYTPGNAFSPQGAGSTLPNMFGQGNTGVNSGTNIAGGGGNIFGGSGYVNAQDPNMGGPGGYTSSAANNPAIQARWQQLFGNATSVTPQQYAAAIAANPGPSLQSVISGQSLPLGAAGPGMQTQNLPAGAASQYLPGMTGAGAYGTPDQALASLAPGLGWLQNIAAGGGNPVNASPAWNSAVAAMQQQIGTGAADLAARFAGSGNLDSSTYGTAMQQYMNQAQLQENALTAQYGFQSATDAQNRLLSAAQQLGGAGTSALQQLSSQAYGANQATQAQQAAAALAMLQAGTGAAGQLSAQSYGAAGQLNQAAIQGVLNNLQNQQFLQSLGMSGASQLSQNWIQNLMAGMGLGQNQYIDQQSAINNQYQEFLRTQPYNNPLLQMMYSAITTYPGQAATSYAPSSLGSILQGFGSLLGAGGLSNIGQILQQLGIGGTPGALPGSTPPNWTIGGGIDTGGGGGEGPSTGQLP